MLNGILLVDKAPGWTSHDVVAKCRGILRERRIGHGGTLDPMATGLLVLLVGPSTKLSSRIPGDKEYIASMRFGLDTDTHDTEGKVVREYGFIPKTSELEAVLPQFRGELAQIPPMVSAIKIGGKKLYELARKGIEIEREARPVKINELSLQNENAGEYTLRVRCSAGTYIRALIRDIGHTLGTGAVMTALRRTASGPFRVEDAVPVEAVHDRLLIQWTADNTNIQGD